ncbi:MAG: UDP-N-acetylmuramoyl-L-alanyl-D-glutamate--2,6-diaminopimelate ligase [Desulfuromonas sp.]|nr:MAG: UDP-N-acetylmuramoyl-L-alanyl-D-glutamate--2,6-diaminopimelate ligase [Desulfuromonas sp.]
MRLDNLLQDLPEAVIHGPKNPLVGALVYDSRRVVPQSAFFALVGVESDGHAYIKEAVAGGAAVIFVERSVQAPKGVTLVEVPDTRLALSLVAERFFGQPTSRIPVIGVTGTNGKTTVTYLVEALLQAAGYRPAVFGTVAYRFEGTQYQASHTTPETVDLLQRLSEFMGQGCNALVMEVSSHALAQHRVAGIGFDVVAFTNLTPEHLDYHKDLEDYFSAKARLFCTAGNKVRKKVLNVDDPYGQRLAEEHPEAVTFGLDSDAQVSVVDPRLDMNGIHGRLQTPSGHAEFESRLLGRFNLENLLCAATIGVQLGLSAESIASALKNASAVPGRLEQVNNTMGALILVDYAHTGDALDKALEALRALKPTRLLTLFGCGGDRDRSKRPVMGEAAARYSDQVIVTSDNPRTEDPQAILQDILPGLTPHLPELTRAQMKEGGGRGFTVIPDRREALTFAVSLLREGDALLAAGKGHEDYQVVGREKQHFDDREELKKAVERREETLCV